MTMRKLYAGVLALFALVAAQIAAPQPVAAFSIQQALSSNAQCAGIPSRDGGAVINFTSGCAAVNGRYVAISEIISTSRNSVGYAETKAGILVPFAANVARITDKGLLVEEARTNLVLQSQAFDNASWTKGATTVSADATTAPDGTSTADKIVEASGTSVHEIYRAYTVTAAAYTWSVYAKAGERTWIWINAAEGGTAKMTYFNLATGAVGTNAAGSTASIQALGNGWYRCVVTRTMVGTSSYLDIGLASANNTSSYAGDTSKGAYLWGAQLELGSSASSYVATTTGSATRAADVSSLMGSAATAALNSRAAYFQTNAVAVYGVGASPLLFASGSSTYAYVNPANPNIAYISNGNVVQATFGSGTIAGRAKIALGFDTSSITAKANGGSLASHASAGTVTGTVYIGNSSAGDRALNGYMERLTFSNTKGIFDSQTAALVIPFNFAANENEPMASIFAIDNEIGEVFRRKAA